MIFMIEGLPRDFTSIKTFRAAHDLPAEFAVQHFEPKDYTDLGSIDRAGEALNELRVDLVAVAPQTDARTWLPLIAPMSDRFRAELLAINTCIGLRAEEIDYAVSGLSDVLTAVVYARLRDPSAPFSDIYADWLADSIRVAHTVHTYGAWRVQVITHAYGRFGLVCHQPDAPDPTHYVYDAALACPAQGFMDGLLAALAACVR